MAMIRSRRVAVQHTSWLVWLLERMESVERGRYNHSMGLGDLWQRVVGPIDDDEDGGGDGDGGGPGPARRDSKGRVESGRRKDA